MSIRYISGGLLGDFIHQLSIINEIFLKTNKKGILFIANIGDNFRNGLEKTYNDLYEIIALQEYITEFKIYNNEEYDIDLSKWRYYQSIDNIYNIFKILYDIEWAKHKWLNNIPKNLEWENKIIINTVNYRFPDVNFFEKIKDKDKSNYVYVSIFKYEYEYFTDKTNIVVDYYSPKSLMELCVILNSCKQVIGSLSGVLSIATAVHSNCVYGIDSSCSYLYFLKNMDKISCIKYEID
jgi:hypothetical protein